MSVPIQAAEIIGNWMYEFGSLQNVIQTQLAIDPTLQGENILTPPSNCIQANPVTICTLLRTTRLRQHFRLSWRMELAHVIASNVTTGEMLVVLSVDDAVRLVMKRDVDTSKASPSSIVDSKEARNWSLHFNEISGPRVTRRPSFADLVAAQDPKSLAQNTFLKRLRAKKGEPNMAYLVPFEEALISARTMTQIYTSPLR